MSKNQQQQPKQNAAAAEEKGIREDFKELLTARLKFKRQVELDGCVYRPDGGEGKDGVYVISLKTVEGWGWYGEALVKDGEIVEIGDPVAANEEARQSSQLDAAAAIAAAAKVNAENGTPMTDEQKATAEAAARANEETAKLMQQANDAAKD